MKKVAIVAGGAKSLGKFLALGLDKNNYQVVVLDLNKEKLDQLKEENHQIDTFVCDLTNEKDVINVFEQIESKYKTIDTLVYNAGWAKSAKITSFEYQDFITSLKINLDGYFLTAKQAAKIMIKNNTKGNIIQINSKSGRVGSKYNSGYSAAKFGGVGLTQSLALDLAEHNIRVNSLMLGNLLDSEMFESLIPQYAKKLNIKESEVKQYYINKVPLKRGCSFEDVLNVLLFYISDKASYCTGQSINITGGQVM
ncbi:sorbitol-6-phosphate dehydrogenase [Mycoplasma mycoides]|uniref:Sorbitol-6-phosphate dehydrogenase n=1 Tax=Mycoplasma mycoides subsp. capri TaxID=40477 RepID=A0AB38GD38_MYCMC|nr:sorbitol-6-phosphate dehydrogenase [Mycoplasma mycoides]ADH22201.1 sorbitol-6-phosphate 2-dehydrogenase (Glucitol-6-phosphate dehydrogenase) (Ketosephosphate reductase) [synthetic Mycoplasma mycoides JCVI-syn1.0]ACU78605.1 sorbitol-6-phosphate 2-dehydrogenase [Mycoplasma mycoides subsp. capri str. GM12]ACU79436.1 sorbitol-6-phosphate 2-dehydrogenase [Mycoplasma mycoides subsp. capri str. GM12]SRX60817.1 sorbitol-6-phosphate dehydrogenase [Mycoplasma mycoides subsp. capri]SRX60979.1 sorbitol